MTLLSLCAMLLVAEPEADVEDMQPDRGPKVWEVYAGVMGGMRVADPAGGGGFVVGLNRKFWFFRPEALIGLGLYAQPVDMLTVIRIGTRVEWPWGEHAFRPYLWLAFAHNHESGIDNVIHDPVAQVFGLSEHGVHHRSGGEVGLGFDYELPRILTDTIRGKVGGRVTFTNFFGDDYPPRYLDFTGTVGIAF
jgi:hypothetical protein